MYAYVLWDENTVNVFSTMLLCESLVLESFCYTVVYAHVRSVVWESEPEVV